MCPLKYAVIFPSEMRCHRSDLACLHLEGAVGGASVQLTMKMAKGNISLIEKNIETDSFFSCVSFEVPPPSEGTEEVAVMEVSIKSSEETIRNSSKVLVKRARSGILVQTDKPIYKPGQTVKFRVLSLKENLQPDKVELPVIELQDPDKNRIGQWLNVKLRQGIAELSLPLTAEPQLGEYSIRVKDTVHTFSVEEYVLPKFQVTLQFPKVILFNREQFPLQVCGRYTYGKPVQGVYKITVCRKSVSYYWMRPPVDKKDLCVDFMGELDRSGCSSVTVESSQFNMNKTDWQMSLDGAASITEEGTGIELSTSSSVSISSIISQVTFINAHSNYKPGIPYTGEVRVVDTEDNPIINTKVYLTSRDVSVNETLVTDENGEASFKLENTNNWTGNVYLLATTRKERNFVYESGVIYPEHRDGNLNLKRFHSRSESFLKLHSVEKEIPCEGQKEVRVEYILKHNELGAEATHMDLHYLVTSKGTIKDSGSVQVPVNSDNKDLRGDVSIKLKLSADVSPVLHALVYILLPDGEMVADSGKFKVLRCFQNKVSVGFSPDEVLPGSDVSLNIGADAGSLCGLRVVDQSVVLMKPEKELTADKVHGLFPFQDFGGYDYRIQDYEHRCPYDPFPNFPWWPGSELGPRGEALERREMKLKIITSSDIMKPVKCIPYGATLDRVAAMPSGPMGGGEPVLMSRPELAGPIAGAIPPQPEQPKSKEIIRKYFPETWIWALKPVGDSGSVNLQYHVPDTITDWNAGAFCMGPTGFGLSTPASLRAFQPFFVELALPYSVVRGESFTLKASVFNYLKQCIKVQTTLQPSLELEEEPCLDCQYTSCLCADESKTFYWNLKATKLGEVNITVRTEALDTKDLCNNEFPFVPKQGSADTVIRPLLVQPGGVLEEKAHSSLLCTQEGQDNIKVEEVQLKVPENILKDSERAHVTVLGDLMGTALQNLDRLLAMPYGCGEQNMVLFAPNIFILQYLEKTQQLNPEIESKAKKFLESGYQRQLTYKHDDGSYSAFGKSDKEGNTWLSAFVVKSFSKARPYIFIDESHLNHSFTWLKNNRHNSGCFQSVGKLFNNAMKGGVDDEISLSAYVTIALVEAGVPVQDPLVVEALSCLRKAAVDVSSVYTQALLAYTFTLCGENDLRQSLLDKLEEKAVRGDGQLHWEKKSTPPSDLPFWYRAPSSDVELTSYVLLTLLYGPTMDLGKASEIVNWLSKQQNPYGGFSSTQDTIVALQALAKYAEATYSDKGDIRVSIRSKTGFEELFHVDKTNRLLLQRASLPDIPGDYTVTATGSGCVYVQTVLRYNVPPPRSDVTFAIQVEIKPKQCPQESMIRLQIHISVKYTGSREKSNMAIIEVKMLSGFIPVKSSVRELEKSKIIQRSDIKTDMVTLYLDELGHETLDLAFMIEQDIVVKNLKPATVKVYDYYETDEHAIAEYNSPCSSDEEKGNLR
ncbi:LOW QUALITY PROTEIN: alpha-2-macroglobulin-like protein 1 [Rhinophrynus dorsalis]